LCLLPVEAFESVILSQVGSGGDSSVMESKVEETDMGWARKSISA
jgi:hypothetical protein